MTRYGDISLPKDCDRISSKEIRAMQDASRARPGRFKSGILDHVEAWKHNRIEPLGVTGDELENWKKNWAFASGWEDELCEYYMSLRESGFLTDLRYEPTVIEMYDHPRVTYGMKNRRYEPDFWIQYESEDDGHYVEVKGFTTKRGLPGGPKIKNLWRCYPELATRMHFYVERGTRAHKQIRSWKWVDRDQIKFMETIRRHRDV